MQAVALPSRRKRTLLVSLSPHRMSSRHRLQLAAQHAVREGLGVPEVHNAARPVRKPWRMHVTGQPVRPLTFSSVNQPTYVRVRRSVNVSLAGARVGPGRLVIASISCGSG